MSRSHTFFCMTSDSPQYKEWAGKFNQANQRKAEQKTAQHEEKQNRSLTAAEQRIVTAALDKYNAEIRRRYGLKTLSAGIEIR